MNRKTPCDCCGNNIFGKKTTTQVLIDGSEDTVYEERCVQCDNLVYGWVKKTKQSTIELIQNKEEKNNGTNKLIPGR